MAGSCSMVARERRSWLMASGVATQETSPTVNISNNENTKCRCCLLFVMEISEMAFKHSNRPGDKKFHSGLKVKIPPTRKAKGV